MKRIQTIINCLANKIKNKFFNSSKTDISHECEEAFNLEEITSIDELKMTEDYALKYNSTTRWQTL